MSSSRTRGAPWEWVSLVLVSVFVFLRAFRLPPLVSTGLDGSWQLALTEAHLAGLAFGKDIVFTYGPLGYLAAGSAVWSAYRGMVAFAFALAVLCALAVAINLTGRSPFAVKCAFVIAIAFAVTEAWTPDVLLLSLMLLWVSPWIRAARGSGPVVAIGFLSGLALLVKFNLGVAAVAGGLAVFALPGFPPRLNTVRALAFLVAVVVASGASFASATYGVSVSLALAIVAAGALLARDRARGVPSAAFTVVAVLCAIAMAILPAYREYLHYSLQIASGYSSAMMIEGPNWQLVLAFCVLAVVGLILVGNVRTLGLGESLALALVAFLEFKEGFVRQDLHVLYAFWTALLVCVLCFACPPASPISCDQCCRHADCFSQLSVRGARRGAPEAPSQCAIAGTGRSGPCAVHGSLAWRPASRCNRQRRSAARPPGAVGGEGDRQFVCGRRLGDFGCLCERIRLESRSRSSSIFCIHSGARSRRR